MKNQARMEKPHSVDRVKVPLPRDLDPRVHIELKNKLTGEVGFQLVRAGNTRRKRMEFLAREIEGRPEMPFPRLTYVDRAMVSCWSCLPLQVWARERAASSLVMISLDDYLMLTSASPAVPRRGEGLLSTW